MIFEKQEIINERAINLLAKSYNTLDYSLRLTSLLKDVFPTKKFDHFSKYQLHEFLNNTLLQNYHGEEIFKYKLFERNVKKRNIVGAFEIKVNNSRVDFLTINGVTTSYEIKSALDNLSKLSKQIADYLLTFEYNYLVVDEKHLEKSIDILPENFGLWSYKNGKYRQLKKAELNDGIDPEMQLKLLTKKELHENFREEEGIVKDILRYSDADHINEQFKKALKSRYRNRWEFIISNQHLIFPIDIQFFFNTNIQPDHIYHY